MIFYLQILGPIFGRTYLKDHEELAVHIKHACRVGVDPGPHQKVSHDVHPNGTHTQIFENLAKSVIWHPNLGHPCVPFGCTYCKALLGRNTMGPYLKGNHIALGCTPLLKKSSTFPQILIVFSPFLTESLRNWFWGDFLPSNSGTKLWKNVSQRP